MRSVIQLLTSAVDLTFASVFPQTAIANVKSQTALKKLYLPVIL
jgi:hypothetical protein